MARTWSRSRSPQGLAKLPSIPELERLDSDTEAQTDACEASSDLMSSWCDAQLRAALDTLMQSKNAKPFIDGQSSSSMTLQAVLQNLQDGKYVSNAEYFWADVDACWDGKDHFMANEMRSLAAGLELDFWNRRFTLEQCPSTTSIEAQDGVSWIMDMATDWSDWFFYGSRNEA